MPFELQEQSERVCCIRIVIDDQHAPWLRLELLPDSGRGSRACDPRQSHLECRSSPEPIAACGDLTFVHFDQTFDHWQSDPQAALGTIEGAIALHKQVEDLWKQLRRDAGARVGNFDEGAVPVPTGTDPDLPTRFRVLGGVREDVACALDQSRKIAL